MLNNPHAALDVLAPRGADRGLNAAGGQRVAEADHRLVAGREVGRVGNPVEADQVDAAFDAVQQARQFADVARGVVQPLITMYSNDTRRWWVKSYSRRIAATSAIGHARSTGMISIRSSWKGLWRLTAR